MPTTRRVCRSINALSLVGLPLFAAALSAQTAKASAPAATSASAATSAPAALPSPAAKAQLAANHGKLPLSFEANQGQTDKTIQYLSHGQGYTLFLRPDEAVLALNPARKATPRPAAGSHPGAAPTGSSGLHNSLLDNSHKSAAEKPEAASIVRMKLLGANPHPVATELEPQITRTNYFIGSDPKKWHTDVPNYARVKYSAIYPGIDLVYYGNQRQLEHDFVVAPGADPSQIVLHLDGSTPHIDPKTGDLVLKTRTGELRFNRPITYQQIDGQQREVASSYKLLSVKKVGFKVGNYDHYAPLIIDPVLIYTADLGGLVVGDPIGSNSAQSSLSINPNAVAIDAAGNAYVGGYAVYNDFECQRYCNTLQNAFISEIDAAGTAVVYTTYLGGPDCGYGVTPLRSRL